MSGRASGVPSDGRDVVERLPTAECWALLEAGDLGRLAVVRADDTPDIFPVNYRVHEGALYLRSARDAKLMHVAHHPAVAFEIDGATASEQWSVVVRGTARRLTDDAEIRESGVRDLVTASPVAKHYVMRITPEAVTGRRFPRHVARADPIPPAPAPRTAEPPGIRSRAERPHPIPHRPPTETGSIPLANPGERGGTPS